MPMILNTTAAMLSITCKHSSRVLNFVPGTMKIVEKEEFDEIKEHRVFQKWVDDESLVTGSKAKKSDVSKEISDVKDKDKDKDK